MSKTIKALTQSHALTETNEESSRHEASQVVPGGKGLHHRGDDGHQATDTHTPSTSEEIGLTSINQTIEHL